MRQKEVSVGDKGYEPERSLQGGGERDMSHKGRDVRQKGVRLGEKGTREKEDRDIKQNNSRNLDQRKNYWPQWRRQ